MKVEAHPEDTNIPFRITGVEGDMGEHLTMFLIQQGDGDVIIGLEDPTGILVRGGRQGIEFCTGTGGSRRPVISKKLRELIAELVKEG